MHNFSINWLDTEPGAKAAAHKGGENNMNKKTLVEVFQDRCNLLSEGKPIVATSHLYNEVSQAALLEIWNKFAEWQKGYPHTIAEDMTEGYPLFTTEINGKKVC